MSSEKQIAHLLRELKGRYAIPRKNAADALVKIGAAAVPGLVETLKDKNLDAQDAAADALTRIATPEALAAVRKWREA